MTIYTCQFVTPFRRIFLASSDEGLVLVGLSTEEKFLDELQKKFQNAHFKENAGKNRIAIDQLDEYFKGQREHFSIPIQLSGTDFQKKVWNVLLKIPYGRTISYSEIANKIGNPKAVRAVGYANNRNPISIVVPCHRVIGSDGKLVGYGGGLDMKENLLKLEGAILA